MQADTAHSKEQRAEHRYKGLALSFLFTGAVRGLGVLTALTLNVVIARQLMGADANDFFYSVTLLTILAALSRGGLEAPLVRFLGASNTSAHVVDSRTLIKTAVVKVSLISVAVAVLLSVVAASTLDMPRAVKFFSLALPPVAIIGIVAFALQGLGKPLWSTYLLFTSTPAMALALILVNPPHTTLDAVWLYLLAVAGTLAIALTLSVINLPPQSAQKGDRHESDLRGAWPMLATNIFTQLTLWAPYILYSHIGSEDNAELLYAAARTAVAVSLILAVINTVFGHRAARLYASDNIDALRRLLQHSMLLGCGVGLPLCAILLIAPDTVMQLWGQNYVAGATAMQVVAIGQLINLLTGPVGNLLAMTGNGRGQALSAALAALVAAGTSIALIPDFGMIGAAIATTLGLATQNVGCSFIVYRKLKFFSLSSLPGRTVIGKLLPPAHQ